MLKKSRRSMRNMLRYSTNALPRLHATNVVCAWCVQPEQRERSVVALCTATRSRIHSRASGAGESKHAFAAAPAGSLSSHVVGGPSHVINAPEPAQRRVEVRHQRAAQLAHHQRSARRGQPVQRERGGFRHCQISAVHAVWQWGG